MYICIVLSLFSINNINLHILLVLLVHFFNNILLLIIAHLKIINYKYNIVIFVRVHSILLIILNYTKI